MQTIGRFNHIGLEGVRDAMIKEVDLDVSANQLYISSRLTQVGRVEYLSRLKAAIQNHDDSWFASTLSKFIQLTELRGMREVKVPKTASLTLAQGEFNLYYMRGLCNYAVSNLIDELQVCRFKTVRHARRTSSNVIGTHISAYDTLTDLRKPYSQRISPLSKPNSGLTLCIPSDASH